MWICLPEGGIPNSVVGRGCRIPHRDVVTFSDHVLNCRPEVRKRRSYALYKLGKSFRTIFLARDPFVTPVHEIRRENLGGGFETPAIEHFFDDHSDLRFVIFAKRFSRAARIDAGDDCIAARIGIAIERLSRSGAGV
jgi:hypothetical protein